ncbi:MAG: hypothetical protein JWM88_1319 [Verrucomicrobia bacterium]|nr:hypothetical protein [Verrucomicrobiota bacterium]
MACLRVCLQRLPLGVLLLKRDGEILYANPEARECLGDWHAHDGDVTARHLKRLRVPALIIDACSRLAKNEGDAAVAGVSGDADAGEPEGAQLVFSGDDSSGGRRVRVRHPECREMSAEVCSLGSAGIGGEVPRFFVRFSQRMPARRGRVGAGAFAVLDELPPKEREVALLLAEGLSDHEISRRLGKSRYTVKTQLRSVYRKLEVKNRTQLVLLLR